MAASATFNCALPWTRVILFSAWVKAISIVSPLGRVIVLATAPPMRLTSTCKSPANVSSGTPTSSALPLAVKA